MDLSGLPDCLFLSQIRQHLNEVLLQFSCLCPSAVSIQVFLWVSGLTKPNQESAKHKLQRQIQIVIWGCSLVPQEQRERDTGVAVMENWIQK